MNRDSGTIDNTDWAAITRLKTLLYPDTDVVRLVSRYRSQIGDRVGRALDIGCGSGRHVKLLIEKNFHTVGLDFSTAAVDVANETFSNVPGFEKVLHADYRTYDFPHRFDVVLAWGVVFLVPPSQMIANLKRMLELCTDEGVVLFDLRTKDNWFYGLGQEIEEDSFMLDHRAGPYEGLLYSFFTPERARNLISDAGGKILSMEHSSFTKDSMQQTNSWLQLAITPN